MASGGQRVVLAALLVNALIAGLKFVAAYFSRSTAMLAEACHSLADTTNQIFLLLGMRRSQRAPTEAYPFGYGPETYFWAFMVALSIFAIGAGFSVHEGIEKILHRHDPAKELGDARWAYGVLGVSILLELYSFKVAWAEFRTMAGGRRISQMLDEARDTTVVTVLFEDAAALAGLVVAFLGVLLTRLTGNVMWDGLASVMVGVVLGAVAWVLARLSKSLLIGAAVTPEENARIREIVLAQPDVLGVIHQRTIHRGPEDVLLAIKVQFRPDMDVATLEHRINDMEAALRQSLPKLRRIYVEPGFDERAVREEPA